MAQEPSRGNDRMSARIIHDGSSRNRAVALRDGHAEPRDPDAYSCSTLRGRAASLPAVRCVATALARSSALCIILARRKNTAMSSDFRLRDCSRSVHE